MRDGSSRPPSLTRSAVMTADLNLAIISLGCVRRDGQHFGVQGVNSALIRIMGQTGGSAGGGEEKQISTPDNDSAFQIAWVVPGHLLRKRPVLVGCCLYSYDKKAQIR